MNDSYLYLIEGVNQVLLALSSWERAALVVIILMVFTGPLAMLFGSIFYRKSSLCKKVFEFGGIISIIGMIVVPAIFLFAVSAFLLGNQHGLAAGIFAFSVESVCYAGIWISASWISRIIDRIHHKQNNQRWSMISAVPVMMAAISGLSWILVEACYAVGTK